MKKKLTSIILTLTMVTILGGCGKSSDVSPKDTSSTQNTKTSATYEKIKKSGQIVVGTSAGYPPFEFHKSINGTDNIIGLDMDIANEFAKDLGVKLVIKDIPFDGLLAALNSGNVDFAIAGMHSTPERVKKVDFSKPYYSGTQKLVVRTADKDKYKTLKDFDGKDIGVQKGTVQEKLAGQILSNSTAKSLPKIPDLIMSLESNKIDAVLMEEVIAKSYIYKDKNIAISDVNIDYKADGIAAAFKKGDTDLVNLMNKTLDRLQSTNSIDKFFDNANKLTNE